MGEPTLYDNAFSPYAFKVRATLYEKGVAHQKHEMRSASDREALLAVNPRGEVPALVHDGALVSDSSVICEYLETVFPDPPLLPPDAAGQARCRALERLADGPLDGVVIVLAVVKMMQPNLGEANPEVAPRCEEQIRAVFSHLDAELAGREFLCGAISRADLALFPHVAGAQVLGVPPGGDRLAAWHQRMASRPAIERAFGEFMAAFQASQQDPDPFFSRDETHVRDHRLEWMLRMGLGTWLMNELEKARVVFSPVP